MMTEKIIVASHRRSGTHLTIDAIINNFRLYRDTPPIPSVTLDRLSTSSGSRLTGEEHYARIKGRPSVLKTHAHGDRLAYYVGDDSVAKYITHLYDKARIIYVHRDGRDVMVSLYHYQKRLGQISEEATFYDYLRGFNDFDTHSYAGKMRRLEYWVYHVRSWMDDQDILFVSYDDLQGNYVMTLQAISAFIGVPLDQKIRDVRRNMDQKGYFARLVGHVFRRVKGIRYSTVGFRRGVSGDWKNYFSAADAQYFDARAGELNHQLGYQQKPADFCV